MKERFGVILGLAGCVLLVQPTLDVTQIMQFLHTKFLQYWPFCLVIAGMFLMQPRKKKTRTKN